MGSSSKTLSFLGLIILSFGLQSSVVAATLFEETFSKDVSGNLAFSRVIMGEAGPATVVFMNGTDGSFDGVKKGRIDLNTVVVYGGLDFKVTGTIFKSVALVDGPNTLDIALGGPVGGQMTVMVIQGSDEPTLEFPPDTVFVSAASIDSQDGPSCGTRALPCRTISYGQSLGRTPVAVASGIYAENVHLVDGQDLLGGYNPEFTIRDLAALRAVIRGDPTISAAVVAANIGSPTTFEGFVIFAPSNRTAGADSIGIHISNSTSAIQIKNNLIFSGIAGNGLDGLAGTDGMNGNPGANGTGTNRFYTTDILPDIYLGGVGGSLTVAATDISGGEGGSAPRPIFGEPQGAGADGQGPSGGPRGLPGINALVQAYVCEGYLTEGEIHAGHGGNGADGGNGSAGQGGVAGIGAANDGENGTNGSVGSGGGGGGAGAGADGHPSCDSKSPSIVYGPTGGGGGSGADYGAGGVGGGGGGTSFGLLILGPGAPVVGSNEIFLGAGGDGGRGGRGGFGGFGGVGGFGGQEIYFDGIGFAGNGGQGGDGGTGGGAGGGAGGLSVGIYADFEATGSYDTDNEIHIETGAAGKGGEGGYSYGETGSDGENGTIHATLFQP